MEMPKLLYIRGRRYFRAGDLLAWEKKFPDLSGSHKRPTSSAKVKAESKTRVSTITEAVVKAVNEALDEPADHET